MSEGVPNVPNNSAVGNTISPAKYWFFTFNNYLESDIEEFCSVPIHIVSHYVFQEELGDNGTRHLQGHLAFVSKTRPLTVFKGTRWGKDVHWEKTKSGKAATAYCTKLATSNGKKYNRGWLIPKAPSIIKTLNHWQRLLKDKLLAINEDRKIMWYWERQGNTGKSSFTKYMCYHHDALVLSGKSADMMHGIVKFHESKHAYPEIIIIDLPRSYDKTYLNYSAIEKIKDGCFYSSKYEGGMVVMPCPRIVIFSNDPPNKEKLSMDRWDIVKIPTITNFDEIVWVNQHDI